MPPEQTLGCDCDCVHADTVQAVRTAIGDETLVYQLADFFKVLGDTTRMRILNILEQSEVCVCDIAVLTGMTKSAVSHQLRALRAAKLVKGRRDGKNVYYSLDDLHVNLILDMGMAHIKEEPSNEEEL